MNDVTEFLDDLDTSLENINEYSEEDFELGIVRKYKNKKAKKLYEKK